jgi:hypothetical protein
MCHAIYTKVNQGDSRLLVVGSQINSLNFGPSFGHNLCFKYPNGSCNLNLDIYVSRAFQWYNELFNPMNFDPCSCLLKIQKSIKTSTVATLAWPSVGVKPNTWKSWGFGVLRDSRMFRARQQGAKHLALGCSWCRWKGLET